MIGRIIEWESRPPIPDHIGQLAEHPQTVAHVQLRANPVRHLEVALPRPFPRPLFRLLCIFVVRFRVRLFHADEEEHTLGLLGLISGRASVMDDKLHRIVAGQPSLVDGGQDGGQFRWRRTERDGVAEQQTLRGTAQILICVL